ncbi:uncharacterized protein BROUX77_004135 [Berkeleyomyces rouxiae]|uniref:uncharacterized protein n=1 Tax=Berkeleyomyces rouxiae TaxID=2035830 RepID=UPI003B7D70F2
MPSQQMFAPLPSPVLPALPVGQDSPKWARTIFGVRHITKSPLMQRVPCFMKDCDRRAVREGGMYCERHTRCHVPNCKFPRFNGEASQKNQFCIHHTCTSRTCNKVRVSGYPLCDSHLQKCTSFGCTRFAIRGMLCDIHICTVVGCREERAFEGWCDQHARCEKNGCYSLRDKVEWPGAYCSKRESPAPFSN